MGTSEKDDLDRLAFGQVCKGYLVKLTEVGSLTFRMGSTNP